MEGVSLDQRVNLIADLVSDNERLFPLWRVENVYLFLERSELHLPC